MVKVHGKLYSSTAFVEAHRTLQDSPPKPGCDLPRFIIVMMFASDGMELTLFSNAKLWPLYLGLGNDTKYRRSRPSCHAFEHVAYFEMVSLLDLSLQNLIGLSFLSFRVCLSLLWQTAMEAKGQMVPL